MEVNGGYLSSSDYSARAEEIYQEDDNEDDEGLQSLLTTWRGANRFILAGSSLPSTVSYLCYSCISNSSRVHVFCELDYTYVKLLSFR